MTARSVARTLLDEMAGIERGPALERLASEKLRALSPEDAARAIAELARHAPAGVREHKAFAALCGALLPGAAGPDGAEGQALRARVLLAATALGLDEVTALLTDEPPEVGRNAADQARKRDRAQSQPTLGHRTQRARVETEPDRLARLAADEDPAVIRNLLLNPRLTEALVLRIASRRPTSPALLLEVSRSRRFNVRRPVQRALVLNPYAPPSLSALLLPHAMSADLKEVAQSPVLHPAVREAARALLRARGDHVPLGERPEPTQIVVPEGPSLDENPSADPPESAQ